MLRWELGGGLEPVTSRAENPAGRGDIESVSEVTKATKVEVEGCGSDCGGKGESCSVTRTGHLDEFGIRWMK